MEKKYMERLVGKYCKIVTKEPGEDRASVVTGILEDVDYEDGFILVDSEQGLGCLRISTIIAIKPGHKRKLEPGHKKSLKEDKKAMVGIGTMIVFIAMVLVAAVAASILIQTAQTLQQKAYKVGSETIAEVSSGIRLDDSVGYTNANKTVVEFIAFTISPRSGSGYIDLENVFVTIKHDNLTVLHFDENLISADINDTGGVFHTLNLSQLNSSVYGVIAVHDSDNSIITTHGMNVGDSAFIIVNLTAASENGGLEPRKSLSGSIMPELGVQATYDITAPVVFLNRVVDLY
jgi:flagellin FlaB